jgi:enediyne biosynthesis protein E4
MGHWLGVRLRQPGANRDAIGSWIEVKAGDATIERELTVGGGHVSGQLGATHFGLGAADAAEVRVTWPDGETGPWVPVAADQYVTLDRETGEVTPWRLP